MDRPAVLFTLTLLLGSLVPHPSFATDPTIIRYPAPRESSDYRTRYFTALLELALKLSEPEFGGYQLELNTTPMAQSRRFKELGTTLDVMWSMTSVEREQAHQAVHIPLMKGLLGYRVLVINRDDQQRFAAIQTADELRKLEAYQGHDWPDTEILRHNGFRVNTDSRYGGLFKMLKYGRYDYFPRGVLEAWSELEVFRFEELQVDSKHLLLYPTAVYFFVAKENEQLHQRLVRGLEIAIDNGQFDDLFFNFPQHRVAFEQAKLEKRVVHRLDNPLKPKSLPQGQAELWYPWP